MLRQVFLATLTASSVVLGLSSQPAQALCLTSGSGNNCLTFDPGTVSNAVQTYTDSNLNPNNFFQIGFRSSDGNTYSISNVKYSDDGSSFTAFPGTFTADLGFAYGTVINGHLE